MSKRSLYTIVTPLPATVSRDTAVSVLHNHTEMIELNPLVVRHATCKAPPNAPADEFHCTWYELTDKVTYLPGIKGHVSYKACFHDLPRGIQTHVYAPAGLEIKEKWSIGGNEPHEEREIIEIGMAGLGVPRSGLYLREDVDMKCNIFLTNFVKKTLRRAHQVLVDRLVVKADLTDDRRVRESYMRDSYAGAGSSVRSPTTSSMRDTQPSISDTSMIRGGSIRSDAASSDTATPTYGMYSTYSAAELHGSSALPLTPAPLSPKGGGYDLDFRALSNPGMVQTHPAGHPSNAFGIPPPAPIEME